VRRVYVEARVDEWDYFPGGFDFMHGVPGAESSHASHLTRFDPPASVGSRFLKLRFHRFVDASFSEPWPADPSLGLLGFLAHAEVGDRIAFTLRNRAHVPVSAHPHGVMYTKANEGLPSPGQAPDEVEDDAIAPGGEFAYVWDAAERSGPAAGDGVSSLGWLVHSHVDEAADVAAGLVGFVAVTRRGWARPDGSPADVDREFAVLWSIQDEGKSTVRRESMAWALAGRPVGGAADAASWGNVSGGEVDAALEAAAGGMGMMQHSVNGRLFGTLGGLEMREGERVRWYSAALGDDRDVHTAHWHGGTVVEAGSRRVDTITLLPATHSTADMVPDAVGTFLLHCHVDHHMAMGMAANWTVLPCGGDPCPASPGTLALRGLQEAEAAASRAQTAGTGNFNPAMWLWFAAGATAALAAALAAAVARAGVFRCRAGGLYNVVPTESGEADGSGDARVAASRPSTAA